MVTNDKQELFNQIYNGLKGQGFLKSVVKEQFDTMWESEPGEIVMCRYRGANDCRCGVGHIIPDDDYNDNFEGRGIYGVSYVVKNYSGDVLGFFEDIQRAHDTATSPEDMEVKLRLVASEFGLTVPAV